MDNAITKGLMPAIIPPGMIVSFPRGGKKYPVTRGQNLMLKLSPKRNPMVPITPKPSIIGAKNFAS